MLTPGAHVDRYELVCPVGEGGMAQVWVARQRGKHGFEKLFALKSIHPRYADDPAFRTMFLDEARIASSIEHPNVAQVFDLGEDSGLLYLVMEYVDGESLSALMSSAATRQGTTTATVPIPIALRITADVCAGLHAAHRLVDRDGKLRGVVHRDVSPHNVLLAVRGDVKLIDFGIAHAADRAGADTSAGSLKGKINYMAPEQAHRAPVGPFTDVFGAGATLYKMLSGRPPFDGGNEASTLALLMSGVAPPPLADTVPPLVWAIVERALAHDPGDRYASAQEMARAIEAAIAEEGYVPDVATWVKANLSDRARARRAQLAAGAPDIAERKPAPAVPELGAIPAHRIASAAAASTPLSSPPPGEVVRETQLTPGFMDVRALVARGPAPAADLPPAPNGGAKAPARGDEDDAAPAKPRPFKPAEVGYKRPAAKRRVTPAMLAGAAGLLVAAGVALWLTAPGMIERRAIARAREAGVELTIGHASAGFGGASLHDVVARVPRVPELREVRIEEIEIVGLSGREVRVRGLDAKVEGPLAEVAQKLSALGEENRRRIAGTPGDPRRYVLVSGRFTWTSPLGEGTRLEAGQLGFDLDSRGAGLEEVRASIARFDVTTPKSVVGPWSFAYERSPQSARARVLFDPPLMDGPSALVVWSQTGAAQLTVRIPRSPMAHLGVRPAELGLPADAATEVEGNLEATEAADGKIEGKGRLDLWAARLPNTTGPIDVRIEGSASGVRGRPLALDKMSVTVGPFVAAMDGALELHPAGFRLDATWRTHPIACEKLVRAEASKMGPIVAAIQDIAHKTGAARVTGSANASGLLRYDTRSPGELPVTWTAKETCGLSLFGL